MKISSYYVKKHKALMELVFIICSSKWRKQQSTSEYNIGTYLEILN